jgi:hypothetical protein
MNEIAPENLSLQESRTARRLNRLFRIENADAFARRPVGTHRRLIERRAVLVEQLLVLDDARRSLCEPRSPELDRALMELTRAVTQALAPARARVKRIEEDLRVRQSRTASTGLRDIGIGRMLGRS